MSETVRVPANAAAESVRRLREENQDLEEQMRVLRAKQLENSEVLGQLSNLAVWSPPIEEEPETAPEAEPETGPEPEPEPDPEEGGE